MFSAPDRLTGIERCLKLSRKTGTPVDEDLRQLWLHEMRQVQRVMGFAGPSWLAGSRHKSGRLIPHTRKREVIRAGIRHCSFCQNRLKNRFNFFLLNGNFL